MGVNKHREYHYFEETKVLDTHYFEETKVLDTHNSN
jgi:hypothetical protein